jgi:hypothetical protein
LYFFLYLNNANNDFAAQLGIMSPADYLKLREINRKLADTESLNKDGKKRSSGGDTPALTQLKAQRQKIQQWVVTKDGVFQMA